MACLNILQIAPDSPVRLNNKLVGSSRNCPFRSMCIREKWVSCDITASVLTNNHAHMIVDSEYARYIPSLDEAGLC